MAILRSAAFVVIAALVVGCSGSSESDDHSAVETAVETFNWYEEPIALVPPSTEWTRRQYQSQGKSGVQFDLRQGLDGSIVVSEYTPAAVEVAVQKSGVSSPVLQDVIHLVLLSPDKYSKRDRDRFTQLDRQRTALAGVSATRVDYEVDHASGAQHWREIYVLQNGHLFTLSFHGPKKNLTVFDDMVQTVRFPSNEVATDL